MKTSPIEAMLDKAQQHIRDGEPHSATECIEKAIRMLPADNVSIVSKLRLWAAGHTSDLPTNLNRMAFADMEALADWISAQATNPNER